MPVAVLGAAAGTIGGKLYITAGGDASDNRSTATQVYSPTTNTWQAGVPIPTNVFYARGATIKSNLYIVGGCLGSDCAPPFLSGLTQVYIGASKTWTTVAPMPSPRVDFAVAAGDGHLFVVGGYATCCTPLSVVEEYDPATNKWSTLAPMLTPRRAVSAGFINGRLIVVGGEDASGDVLTTVEEYNPGKNSWTTKASLNTPQAGGGASAIGTHLYLVSGFTSGGVAVDTVQDYDALTDTWSTAPSIATGRYMPEPVTIGGLIYVAGNGAGNEATSVLNAFKQ